MEPPEQNAPAPLSWEHRPVRQLIRYALPTTLGGLSFALMGVVDTMLVAAEGAAELAGVGLGAVVTTGIMGFGFGLLRGVKMLIAQGRASGAQAYLRSLVGAGVLIALSLGAIMLVLGELAALIVPYFAATPESARAARAYIAVRSLGAPIIVLYVALREARLGFGDARSPMVTAIVGNVVHAGLDYLVLRVLGWGAAGVALANVAAFTLQTSLLFVASGRGSFSLGRRERALMGTVARAGAFTGLQWMLEIGALALLSLLLAGVSDSEMAAHQIAVQLTAFSFLPALGVADSATVLAAEAVGAGRMGLVLRVARATRNVALTYAGLCAFVFVALGGVIASLFSSDPVLCAAARTVLLAAAAHQLLEAVTVAGHGVLRGVGAQRTSALCSLGCTWACMPACAIAFTRVLALGAPGGWLARIVEVAVASSFVWWQIGKLGWVPSARRAYWAARRAEQAYAQA